MFIVYKQQKLDFSCFYCLQKEVFAFYDMSLGGDICAWANLRLAEQEDLDESMLNDLKAVQSRLRTGYHDALWKHADEVQNYLQQEIASRYYYQKGRTAVKLQRDPCVLKALKY